jgi:hypothetical protein
MTGAGKGDRHRSMNKNFYDNYVRIFGEKPLNNRESRRRIQRGTQPTCAASGERSSSHSTELPQRPASRNSIAEEGD